MSRGSWSTHPLPPNWPAIVDRVLTRDQGICQGCGDRATSVDHIIPRHLGGTDEDSNLQSLCEPCHRRKTAREANAARKRKWSRRRATDPHPGLIPPA